MSSSSITEQNVLPQQLETVDLEQASVTHNDQEEDQVGQRELCNNRTKKLIVALLLVGFVVFVIVDSATNQYIRSGVDAFLKWVEQHPAAGCFVFIAVYFLATVLFVPGLILTLGAGFVFGNALGLGVGVLVATLAVFVGASSGAIVAFLLGRYLLRDWVQGLTKRYAVFEALDVAFEEKGFRIMALLRLSPIIPFNAINYIAGVTAISLRQYVLALVCILPGTILYVFLGSSAGSLTDSATSGSDPTVTIVVVVVGIVFGVVAVLVTSVYAKRELTKVVAARQAQQEAETAAAAAQQQEELKEEEPESAPTSIEMGSDDDSGPSAPTFVETGSSSDNSGPKEDETFHAAEDALRVAPA